MGITIDLDCGGKRLASAACHRGVVANERRILNSRWGAKPGAQRLHAPLPQAGGELDVTQIAERVAPVSVNPPATLACPVVSELDR